MPLRVVQWTTGNVGRRALRAIATNPGLELVGCYAWSADKVGRDAGELAGIEKLGVAATNDVDALLELRPDCVSYTPMWPNVDELVRSSSRASTSWRPPRSSRATASARRSASRLEQACSAAAARCSARA
jgi:hypothetical protein